MRGLKREITEQNFEDYLSHLLQMRGLKLRLKDLIIIYFWSHLLQMRGLKRLVLRLVLPLVLVASFTDAWIETEFKR